MKVEDMIVGEKYRVGDKVGAFVRQQGKAIILKAGGFEFAANPNDKIEKFKQAPPASYATTQKCLVCGERKDLSEFRSTRGGGRTKSCTECIIENTKKIKAQRQAEKKRKQAELLEKAIICKIDESQQDESVEKKVEETTVEVPAETTKAITPPREIEETKHDMVQSPGHYIGVHGLEVREVEENFLPRFGNGHLAHLAGAALEYLLRAPSKGRLIEDLEKLQFLAGEMVAYAKEVAE